jgi:hypothetical protein
LLKGLVHCGSCGARYIGDPCHGKFYYRCMARCRRQPTVREQVLDSAVVLQVERLVTNPSLVLNQIERLKRTEADSSAAGHSLLAEVEKELRQIESEEARLLEAYRSEVITATQLGSELGKLTTRRMDAETRKAELDTKPELAPETVQKSVEAYCSEIGLSFRSFTSEELREFLRTVIRDVIFYGRQIRILGHLPADNRGESTTHDPRRPRSPGVEPHLFAGALQRPAAMNTGGNNEFNPTQEKRIVREGCIEGGGQKVGWAGGRRCNGRRDGIGVNSVTRPLSAPEAQEVTAAGISWSLAAPVETVPQDSSRQLRDAAGRFVRDCAHSGRAE